MIQKVLSAPLIRDKNDFQLSRIRNQDRINELEFYFPLKSISPKRLRRIFEKHKGPGLASGFSGDMERLDFSPVRGFMKGFMDLVFHWNGRYYLVDWKSNHLGNRIEDYGLPALTDAMKHHFYVLQYHLYCLALNQYLKLRLPGYRYEKHFGGVLYIFLRGVDPEIGPDFGIYRDLPSPELINLLRVALIEK